MEDSEMDENTPPDLVVAATEATRNLLPQKSRNKYEKAYKDFLDWKMEKKTNSMSENVLLAYFEDLSKKFSPPSLWNTYSMIKSTLNINNKVDISKYFKLTTFLKRKSEGYKGKKAKTFTSEEVNKFINEAPDQLYLQSKVALIFGVMGACRRQELYNLQLNDVQVFGSTILVNVHNTKTKIDRNFTVTGSYCDLCKKYMELRPKNCKSSNFFIKYSAGKCQNQNIGLNKFGALGKNIAIYLNLPNPEMYTGHCFRRTSATLLVDAGGDITTLKRHGGWKSTAVAEGYIEDSVTNKVNISNKILNKIENKEIYNIQLPSTSTTHSTDQENPTQAPPPILNISNCTNVNIYYNK